MMRSFSSFQRFSISSGSAARTIAAKPERNWRATPRARPTQWPTKRIAFGRSLGPMTMIAMNATNSNSVGATSNIQRAWLAHAPIGARAEGSAILVQRLAVTVEGGIGGLFGRDTITATVFPLIVILFGQDRKSTRLNSSH